MTVKFYLGTNKAAWLRKATVPLFVSHRTLRSVVKRRPSRVDWALDSGGFTELSLNGVWTISPEEYAWYAFVYQGHYGRMDWASQQDWMCEDVMLTRTGKTVAEHQSLTTQNLLDLRRIEPKVHFIPVIQGQTVEDYLRHIDQFRDAGIDLTKERTVGIGSVCRRQSTKEIVPIVEEVTGRGLKLHGFGMKTLGLQKVSHLMTSADSMAWSFTARRQQIRLETCTHGAPKCSDCLEFATLWRNNLLVKLGQEKEIK